MSHPPGGRIAACPPATFPASGAARRGTPVMNYRHAFHAGNFADVVKHATLTRIVEHLKRKEAAFRVIDTHAGIGLYDLDADEASRTGEWRDGIGRLAAARRPAEVEALLAPWLSVIAGLNDQQLPGEARPGLYPGSPLLARRLLRRQDRLTAVELHPADAETLAATFAGDHHTRVVALDGWLALGSFVPPKERRGVVIVDPAFEEAGEMERLGEGLLRGFRRWPTGTFIGWYPIKSLKRVDALHDMLLAAGVPGLLAADLFVRTINEDGPLPGAGLVILNPPWHLRDELNVLMPWFSALLAQGAGAGYRLLPLAER